MLIDDITTKDEVIAFLLDAMLLLGCHHCLDREGARGINMPEVCRKDMGDYRAIRVLSACSEIVMYG